MSINELIGRGDEFTKLRPNYDNFSGANYSLTDTQTSPNGRWVCTFAGGGTVETRTETVASGNVTKGTKYLYLSPTAAVGALPATFAALVRTTVNYQDFDFTADVKTISQLRTGAAPNNWEVAWLMWAHSDNWHQYSFLVKISGSQLEKKDNAIQDDAAEIFLDTPGSPSVTLDTWARWRVIVTGTASGTPRIKVYVNNTLVEDFLDNASQANSAQMNNGGRIGLYAEDAAVGFANISIRKLS